LHTNISGFGVLPLMVYFVNQDGIKIARGYKEGFIIAPVKAMRICVVLLK